MDGYCGLVVGSGGILLHVEGAEVLGAVVLLDVRGPFVAAGVVGDAEVAAGGGGGLAAVGVVLGGGAVAAIALAVVQAVVVDVVADEVGGRVHDQAVHVDAFGFAADLDRAHGVARVHVMLAAPAELREPEVVLRIDLGELALGQGDLAVVAEVVGVDEGIDDG